MSSVVRAGRSLAAKAVHIVVNPQPRTVDESRQILHILKEFGEVVMYRSLRHEPFDPVPNSILAIYQTSEAASRLLAASPLSFIVEPPPTQPLVTSAASFGLPHVFTDEVTSKISDSEHELKQPSTIDDSASLERLASTEFHLKADKSFADHQNHIARQEYYWGFTRNTKSFAHDNLIKSVPLEGLASILTKQPSLPNRLVKRNEAELAERRTLRRLWEIGRKTSQVQAALGPESRVQPVAGS